MTKIGVFWDGRHKVVLSGLVYPISKICVFNKEGVTFEIPLEDLMSCWLRLNGEYSIVNRKKVNFTRNEVFVVKIYSKYYNEYVLYIPMESLGTERIEDEDIELDNAQFIYTYKKYIIGVEDVKFFTEGNRNKFVPLDDTKSVIYYYKDHRPTDKHIKLMNLIADIEKTCGVLVDTWKIEKILENYKITKIRKKKVG